MAPALRRLFEAEVAQDLEDVPAGQVAQPRHQATASSFSVATIVGSADNLRAAKSSPSRCDPIASRMFLGQLIERGRLGDDRQIKALSDELIHAE